MQQMAINVLLLIHSTFIKYPVCVPELRHPSYALKVLSPLLLTHSHWCCVHVGQASRAWEELSEGPEVQQEVRGVGAGLPSEDS